jgi:DNA modification methylase
VTVVPCGDGADLLEKSTLKHHGIDSKFALTFLDPPFNQGKDYVFFNDVLPPNGYWQWLSHVCARVYDLTVDGGAIYFTQREKNTEYVLRVLRERGWKLQNLII